jgi:hypothetical protein
MTFYGLGTHNKATQFWPTKSLDSLDVDDEPPIIMKLADAQHHAQLLDTLQF